MQAALIDIRGGWAHENIPRDSGIELIGVEEGGVGHPRSVSHALLLSVGNKSVEHSFPIFVDPRFVGHDVFHFDPAVLPDFPVRNSIILKELDQKRTRDIENPSSLHSRKFGILRDDGHALASSHRAKDIQQEVNGDGRKLDRRLLSAINHTDTQRLASADKRTQALSRGTGKRNFSGIGRRSTMCSGGAGHDTLSDGACALLNALSATNEISAKIVKRHV